MKPYTDWSGVWEGAKALYNGALEGFDRNAAWLSETYRDHWPVYTSLALAGLSAGALFMGLRYRSRVARMEGLEKEIAEVREQFDKGQKNAREYIIRKERETRILRDRLETAEDKLRRDEQSLQHTESNRFPLSPSGPVQNGLTVSDGTTPPTTGTHWGPIRPEYKVSTKGDEQFPTPGYKDEKKS